MTDEGDLLESEPAGGRYQYGLGSLFLVTLLFGVYFFLERFFQGRFVVVWLIVSCLITALLFLVWLVRLVSDVSEPWRTLVMMIAIGGSVAGAMRLIYGH